MASSTTRSATRRIGLALRQSSTKHITTTTRRPSTQPGRFAPLCLQQRPISNASSIRLRQHGIPCLIRASARTASAPQCRNLRRYASVVYPATESSASPPATADDYIQELQDLYEIAQDELEIAAESTGAATVYAASDRATMREAFDDLDRAYAAYTGMSVPAAAVGETTANAATDVESSGEKLGGGEGAASGAAGGGGDGDGEDGGGKKITNFDPAGVPPDVMEEIKRRVGQRVREMRNAVEALEESAKEG